MEYCCVLGLSTSYALSHLALSVTLEVNRVTIPISRMRTPRHKEAEE